MGSGSDEHADGGRDIGVDDRGDGGVDDRDDVRLDEQELYLVVRTAVEDGILNAIGTLLLLGVALVVVWFGATVAIGGGSPAGFVAGGVAVVFGGYLAASTLDLVPPISSWF